MQRFTSWSCQNDLYETEEELQNALTKPHSVGPISAERLDSNYPVSSMKRRIKKPTCRFTNKMIEENYQKIKKDFKRCIRIVGARKVDQTGDNLLYCWKLQTIKVWHSIGDGIKKLFDVFYQEVLQYKKVIKRLENLTEEKKQTIKTDIYHFRPPVKREIRIQENQMEKKSYRQELMTIFNNVLVNKYIKYQKNKHKPKFFQNQIFEIDSQTDLSSQSQDQDYDFEYIPTKIQILAMSKNAKVNNLFRKIQGEHNLSKIIEGTVYEISKNSQALSCLKGLGLRSSHKVQEISSYDFQRSINLQRPQLLKTQMRKVELFKRQK